MPTLDDKYFQGGGDLPPDLAVRLLARGLNEEVIGPLTAFGWEGQLIAGAVLATSADGTNMECARFLMRGVLCPTPLQIKANLLWRTAADVSLNITLPNAEMFSFAGGTLCSDFLDQEQCAYNFSKGNALIMPGDWAAHKIEKFCLRIVTHLDKSSNSRVGPHIKLTVLVFPGSAEDTLNTHEGAQSVSWPGFRILEGQAEFFPRPPADTWGALLIPIVAVHNRAANCSSVPSGDKLRFAVAELMRTAALPTVCITKAGRAKTIRAMERRPENLEPRIPTVTWPASQRPEADEGRILISLR